MKKLICTIITAVLLCTALTACGPQQNSDEAQVEFVGITLSDDGVLVHGQPASENPSSAVYVSKDIVFYLEGQGADYGEGEDNEEHSQEEADKHTVINITQPGNYVVSGSISHGQIAVNLGKAAKKDPDAWVNIILNNADINCTVAPAIICYKAYECGDDDVDTAKIEVDTSGAGFNITLADGSVNNINGSHVAKIYEPGTTDKLHKYDAAIESLVSMNIHGIDGILNLISDNEGIETKLHMTIHGGNININSADDALNAGEDGVSVITINGGKLLADSNGGSEGDGIDSNGWLVINGGYVSAFGNSNSMDSGLDSDNGVYINGGTVFATGNMYDEISHDSRQNFAVFNFAKPLVNGEFCVLKSFDGNAVAALESRAGGTNWVYSSPELSEGDYTLYKAQSVNGEAVNGIYSDITQTTEEIQLGYTSGGKMWQGGFDRGDMPKDFDFAKMPQNDMAKGERPQGDMPHKNQRPENMPDMIKPEDAPKDFGFGKDFDNSTIEQRKIFTIVNGANIFSGIAVYVAQQ